MSIARWTSAVDLQAMMEGEGIDLALKQDVSNVDSRKIKIWKRKQMIRILLGTISRMIWDGLAVLQFESRWWGIGGRW